MAGESRWFRGWRVTKNRELHCSGRFRICPVSSAFLRRLEHLPPKPTRMRRWRQNAPFCQMASKLFMEVWVWNAHSALINSTIKGEQLLLLKYINSQKLNIDFSNQCLVKKKKSLTHIFQHTSISSSMDASRDAVLLFPARCCFSSEPHN